MTWRGFGFVIMRRELLQSKFFFFPFFCGGKIYNLVINLFYVPLSPVIGCHWSCVRGKRLHGSFPDFPGDFSPAALSVHGVQTVAPPSAFLNLSPSRHQRVFCPEFSGMSGLHASVLFSCVENMSLRGKPARKIMDYLTFEGKLSCILGSLFITVGLPVQFDSSFISHVN